MSLRKTVGIKVGTGFAVVILLSLVITSILPFAASAKDDRIALKAALYGVYSTCYKDNNMVTPLEPSDVKNVYSIARGSGEFILPTEWYSSATVNCAQLLDNSGDSSDSNLPKFPGVMGLAGISIPTQGTSPSAVSTFLENMGYTRSANPGRCATYTYLSTEIRDKTEYITLCANCKAGTSGDSCIVNDSNLTVSYSSETAKSIAQLKTNSKGKVKVDCNRIAVVGPGSIAQGGCETHEYEEGVTLFSALAGMIEGDLVTHRSSALSDSWRLKPGITRNDREEVAATFSIREGSAIAGDQAVKFLGGSSNIRGRDSLKLNRNERISLLEGYMQDYFRVYVHACNPSEEEIPGLDAMKDVYKVTTSLGTDGGFRECYVQPTEHVGGSVSSYNSNYFFDGKTMMDFGQLVEALNKDAEGMSKDDSTLDPSEGGVIDGGSTDDSSSGETSKSNCSIAADSLGWIICPVIRGVGIAASGIYGYIENNFLVTDAQYIDRQSGTRSAWEKFRDFANIAFAAILLIIILSQITGFGVSNYGIKKMLPRLIIVAVLVNLSFLLCEVAVDLSNLIGYSAKQVFTEIKVTGIPEDFGDGTLGEIIGDPTTSSGYGIVPTLLSIGAAGIVGPVLKNSAGVWIWPFLLVLLGAFISIIFFFILLGVRQAGIIILVAVSPLAFVCYALPNTEKVFSRWWKMLFGLLLVYPICGVLMGGGQFASALLLSNIANDSGGSFFYALVAMLIQAVPFFFVPSIVKSSFAAMGNLGMKLSNFGRGLNRGISGGIRRSQGYKDSVARGRAWDAQRSLKRAEKTTGISGFRNRIGARVRGGNNPISRMANRSYDRRRAANFNAVAAQRAADLRAHKLSTDGPEIALARETDALAEDYENTYKRNAVFMGDGAEQRRAYEDALDAMERNPQDQNSIANMRALHNILSRTDDGQTTMQQVLNGRMYAEQNAARAAGRNAQVSDGMQAVARDLSNNHSELKGVNRGFYDMLNDMGSKNKGKVFSHTGDFESKTYTKADGTSISSIGNDYYDSSGAMKYDASSIANAGESALQRLASSAGTMDASSAEALYRSATEAISNGNISVKPENEKYLNDIRRAAYTKMQSDFTTANASNFFDDKGRMYEHIGGDNYVCVDASGGTPQYYERDASTGNFTNMATGKIVKNKHIMNASKKFKADFGNYRDIHSDSSFKVNH